MSGLILCMDEIETLLDQVSSVCGLSNQLDEIHAKPTLNTRRIRKWSLALSKFTLVYFPHKSIKGEALANFMADHPSLEIQLKINVELGIHEVERRPWILKFDGSSMDKSAGVRIVIISPKEIKTTLSFNLAFKCTNNQTKYEVLVIGLKILMELGAQEVHIIGTLN